MINAPRNHAPHWHYLVKIVCLLTLSLLSKCIRAQHYNVAITKQAQAITLDLICDKLPIAHANIPFNNMLNTFGEPDTARSYIDLTPNEKSIEIVVPNRKTNEKLYITIDTEGNCTNIACPTPDSLTLTTPGIVTLTNPLHAHSVIIVAPHIVNMTTINVSAFTVDGTASLGAFTNQKDARLFCDTFSCKGCLLYNRGNILTKQCEAHLKTFINDTNSHLEINNNAYITVKEKWENNGLISGTGSLTVINTSLQRTLPCDPFFKQCRNTLKKAEQLRDYSCTPITTLSKKDTVHMFSNPSVVNNHTIAVEGDLIFVTSPYAPFENHALLHANGPIDLETPIMENNGTIKSMENITITSKQCSQHGTISANGTLSLNSPSTHTNKAHKRYKTNTAKGPTEKKEIQWNRDSFHIIARKIASNLSTNPDAAQQALKYIYPLLDPQTLDERVSVQDLQTFYKQAWNSDIRKEMLTHAGSQAKLNRSRVKWNLAFHRIVRKISLIISKEPITAKETIKRVHPLLSTQTEDDKATVRRVETFYSNMWHDDLKEQSLPKQQYTQVTNNKPSNNDHESPDADLLEKPIGHKAFIHNDGKLTSIGNMKITGNNFYQRGTLKTEGSLSVHTQEMVNQHIINAHRSVVINGATHGASFSNDKRGNIQTGGTLTIRLPQKTLLNSKRLSIINNNGKLTSYGDMTLYTDYLNQDSSIAANSNLFLYIADTLNNNGIIHVNDDLFINSSQVFTIVNNKPKGHIEAGKAMTIDLPKGEVFNRAGTITANEDITIKTGIFAQSRKDVYQSDTVVLNSLPSCSPFFEYIEEAIRGKRDLKCTETINKETSSFGYIASKNGNVSLETQYGVNDASIIIAHGDINIAAHKFKNNSRKLYNKKCNPFTYREQANFFHCRAEAAFRSEITTTITNAGIIAGNTVNLIIGSNPTTISYETQNGNIPHLTNTGYIGAKQSIDISSKETVAQFVNGKVQQPSPTVPHYTPELITLLPYKNNNIISVKGHPILQGVLAKAAKDENYVWDRMLNTPTHQFPLHDFTSFILPLETSNTIVLASDYQWAMTPQLEAQFITFLVNHKTGLPFIPGAYSELEQYSMLKNNGYWFSLINGDLVSRKSKSRVIESELLDNAVVTLTAGQKEYYQQYIDELCIQESTCQRMTPEQLHTRINLIKNGSYTVILDENAALLSPISLCIPTVANNLIVPTLYIDKNTHDTNQQMNAFITAHDIHISVSDMQNFGKIVAVNKIVIKAETVRNEVSSVLSRRYEITTPQDNGEIVGFEVTIEVDDNPGTDKTAGILNNGGTLFARHTISLIAKSGDIANTHHFDLGSHIHAWNADVWQRLSSKDGTTIIDIHQGMIISDGTINLQTQAGTILNQGSHIIGKDNVKLSGYLNTIINGLFKVEKKHKKFSTETSISDLVYETAKAYQASVVSPDGSVEIKSTHGNNAIKGTLVQAGQNVIITATKDNDLGVQSTTTHATETRTGLSFSTLYSSVKKMEQDKLLQTKIIAGSNVSIKAGNDNVMEAVLVHGDNAIHIQAARDNIITNAHQKTAITADTWTLTISDGYATDIIENLANDNPSGAVWAVLDNDPLLDSLHQLSKAESRADYTGAGTIAIIETLALLSAYSNARKKGISKRQFLNDRLRTIFTPQVSVRIGMDVSKQQQTMHTPGILDAPIINISSLEDIVLKGIILENGNQEEDCLTNKTLANETINDGAICDGTIKELTLTSHEGDITIHSGYSTHKATQYSGGITGGASLADTYSVGIDGYISGTSSTTFKTNVVTAEHLHIHAPSGTLYIAGDQFQASTVEANAEHMILETIQDTVDSWAYGGSLSASTAGTLAGGFSQKSVSQEIAPQQASISAQEAQYDLQGILYLIGSTLITASSNSTIEAQEVIAKKVYDASNTVDREISASFNPWEGSETGLYGRRELNQKAHNYEGVNKPTISYEHNLENAYHQAPLNRDETNTYEVLDDEESHYRVVIPIANVRKIANNIMKLAEANDPFTSDLLADELADQFLNIAYDYSVVSDDNEDVLAQGFIHKNYNYEPSQKEGAQESPKPSYQDYDATNTYNRQETEDTQIDVSVPFKMYAASTTADLFPVLGDLKGIYEAYAGRDYFTHEEISALNRFFIGTTSGASLASTFISLGSTSLVKPGLKKLLKPIAQGISKTSKATRSALKKLTKLSGPRAQKLIDKSTVRVAKWINRARRSITRKIVNIKVRRRLPSNFYEHRKNVPDHWHKKLSKKMDKVRGVKYTNPTSTHDSVRFMPGDPLNPNPAQQNPYVIRMKDGMARDINNMPISRKHPNAHIPYDQFTFHP